MRAVCFIYCCVAVLALALRSVARKAKSPKRDD